MAGLQLTVVTDPRSKAAIDKQIAQWDENLEKLYIEQYRLRCYMASLQGSELPNPKVRCIPVQPNGHIPVKFWFLFSHSCIHRLQQTVVLLAL